MLYEIALDTMVGVLPRFFWLEQVDAAEPVEQPAQQQPLQTIEQEVQPLRCYYDGEAFRWFVEE